MAQQILHKRASTSAKVPLTTDLALGELAINTVDGKLFLKKNNGSDAIVEVGSTTFTGDVTGNGNSSVAMTLANSGVAAGTYNKVTVDAKGRVTTGANLSASDVNTILGYTPENAANKNAVNGYAGLGADGKLPSNLLPALAITDTFVVGSDAAMTALTAQTGDVAVRTDITATYILRGSDPSVLSNWQQLLSPIGSSNVTSVNNKTGVVTLTTSDITEGSNLYYTDARAIAAPLTGFAVGSNATIAAADTVLGAFGKVQAQLNAKAASGANSDITSLSGLTTALSIVQGGTGATTVAGIKTNLVLDKVENKASQDIRNDITSADVTRALTYTPLSSAGGSMTGNVTFANNTGLFFKDTSGNAHQTLVYSSDNNLYLNMPSGGTLNFMATSGSPTIAHMDNSGNFTANSFIGSLAWTSVTGKPTTIQGLGLSNFQCLTIPANADLSTYINSGIYRYNDTPAAYGPPWSYGNIIVINGGGDTYGQLYIDYNSGMMASRGGTTTGTIKSAWRMATPTDGTGASGNWAINIGGNAANTSSCTNATGVSHYWSAEQHFYTHRAGYGTTTGGGVANGLFVLDGDGGPACMTFLRSGYWGVNFGLDSDAWMRMGGWNCGNMFGWNTQNGDFVATGNVTAYSDERLKTNWRDVGDNFVERWANVKCGTYDRIDTGETQVGMSAQDVKAILDAAATEDKDGILALNYGGATGVATVKLAQRIIELEAIIEILMKKVGM